MAVGSSAGFVSGKMYRRHQETRVTMKDGVFAYNPSIRVPFPSHNSGHLS